MRPRGLWPWRLLLPPTPGSRGRARPRPRPPQVLCVKHYGNLKDYQSQLYSTVAPPDEVTINYRHGLPLITLTLPSRKERCQFIIKPVLSTVGSFLQDIRSEDKGVTAAAILAADGSEIPASTLMGILLMKDFKLVINKIAYDVQCPKKEHLNNEHTTEMENVKSLVHRLFTVLHLGEFQKKKEHHLLEKIDHLKKQLQPLEQVKARIEARSEAKTSGLLWAGLALLSVQGGALAWLTWWVYSWDIMEPVTYFITFANSMVFFAYFIVTRQNYTYSAVRSRQFLQFFHKKSQQQHFDVEQYNKLKEDLAKATESLKQVRHSLNWRMKVEELSEKN
ncbi:calcium uniporter regulatory subunit MCUb, mitochondrial [Lepus europaeus]|uniref:calcium uniporter regulatory subunit MCUb, mitochondrial n=1 Tax=Lepus europaeus TaxID=9983 RepID=UPI002B4822B8|nr:calcium uniporter regulatory subunit MCUb, mitochondrial [Lepus europaeus]